MAILCPFCKGKAGRPSKQSRLKCSGKSKVVETRRRPSRVSFKGRNSRNETLVRIRECLKCRYRWKTIEMITYTKRRKIQVDHAT